MDIARRVAIRETFGCAASYCKSSFNLMEVPDLAQDHAPHLASEIDDGLTRQIACHAF